MERQRVWIDPAYIDSPVIRAITELHNPDALIFPTKRPKGTDVELARLRAVKSIDSGASA